MISKPTRKKSIIKTGKRKNNSKFKKMVSQMIEKQPETIIHIFTQHIFKKISKSNSQLFNVQDEQKTSPAQKN